MLEAPHEPQFQGPLRNPDWSDEDNAAFDTADQQAQTSGAEIRRGLGLDTLGAGHLVSEPASAPKEEVVDSAESDRLPIRGTSAGDHHESGGQGSNVLMRPQGQSPAQNPGIRKSPAYEKGGSEKRLEEDSFSPHPPMFSEIAQRLKQSVDGDPNHTPEHT